VQSTHHFVYGGIEPEYFMFNNPESACRTCGGLGVHKITHPELLVPDPKRSIRGGCFVKEAYKYNPDTWDGRIMYSLSKVLILARHAVGEAAGNGAPHHPLRLDGRKLDHVAARIQGEARRVPGPRGRLRGIARRIERNYRRYRQRGEANSGMEAWLDKVMVERTCPDCARRAPARHAAAVHHRGQDHPRRGQLNFDELHTFLGTLKPAGRGATRGARC
jgi:excinuclease ABC subunit A